MKTTSVIQAQHSEMTQAPNVPVPNTSLNNSVDSCCQGLRRRVSKAIQYDTDAEGVVLRPPQITWLTLTHDAVCKPHVLLFHINLGHCPRRTNAHQARGKQDLESHPTNRITENEGYTGPRGWTDDF